MAVMRRTVGQVAEVTGVTVRTLHHYDEIGLLSPSERSEAGYRLYAYDDLARLQEILVWRALGRLLVLPRASDVDQGHEALLVGDPERRPSLRRAQDAWRPPVARQPLAVRREEHGVGGAGGRAQVLLVLHRILGAHLGGRDQRRRAVELGRRLGPGGALQLGERLRPDNAEAPRIGQMVVGSPPCELEQLVEQLPRYGLGNERLVCAAAADRLRDIHADQR